DGYFDAIINLHSYPFLASDQDCLLRGSSDELMSRASELAVLCVSGESLDSVDALLQRYSYSGFPIVRSPSTMALVGYIARADVQLVVGRARASSMYSGASPCVFSGGTMRQDAPAIDFRPWVDLSPITIAHSTDLNLVAGMFRQLGVRYVLATHHAMLLGIITKKDIVRSVRM
ncbi:hypothetical protein EV175_007576, partial [Coemansia sp. RSA 1933]